MLLSLLMSCIAQSPGISPDDPNARTIYLPTGVDYVKDEAGAKWAALSLIGGPVLIAPDPALVVGSKVEWAKSNLSYPFTPEATQLSPDTMLQGDRGLPEDGDAQYQAMITVFQTPVPPAQFWRPEAEGYQILYQQLVGHTD
jgi:hypothetical protein